ncbi:MAG: hypothetical protein IKI28_05680 [Bacteroidales bacterium]|nr:hypothetical protein [Bacteroidales bacterium]
MKHPLLLLSVGLLAALSTTAQAPSQADSIGKRSRLTIGGYGETAASLHMHSDNPYRYMYPDRYKQAEPYGRLDIPHVVLMLGYDFGRGWRMGTEVEFEHGGVEAAIEVEGDEAIELEHEIERGGEVALEQFWIERELKPWLNIRAGMIILPVGRTNMHHLPVEFFGVYRPEGESTILPCTWHQIGLSLWGTVGPLRYEAVVVPGLNSRLFNNANWVSGGAASPYEFTVANELAVALRLDCHVLPSLRIGMSGYMGGTNNDAYPKANSKVSSGRLSIASADVEYKSRLLMARASTVYGYLQNADAIGVSNRHSDKSTFSPYAHTFVGRNALSADCEVGLDLLALANANAQQRLLLFGRYEYYDSYVPSGNQSDYEWTDRQRMAVGLNYFPLKEVVIKAEYSHRLLKSQYNPEPCISIGIAYAGFFKY